MIGLLASPLPGLTLVLMIFGPLFATLNFACAVQITALFPSSTDAMRILVSWFTSVSVFV